MLFIAHEVGAQYVWVAFRVVGREHERRLRAQVLQAVSSLKDFLSAQGKEVCNEIYQSGKLEESTEQNLRSALEDWKRTFA